MSKQPQTLHRHNLLASDETKLVFSCRLWILDFGLNSLNLPLTSIPDSFQTYTPIKQFNQLTLAS